MWNKGLLITKHFGEEEKGTGRGGEDATYRLTTRITL